jgi:3-deoxy-D-manno-octulosonic acid kinase
MKSDLKALDYSIQKEDNITLISRSSLPQLWPMARNKGPLGVITSMRGRSPLRFIEPDMVVRTLVHGGIFRYITGKNFISPNRTIRELEVSAYLASQGIPTPEILSVRLIKGWFFYSIDVVSRLVPDSTDLLVYFEKDREDCRELFRKAGILTRKIHELGVYHTDLHIKNILLDSMGDLWVLDLDKAYHVALLPEFMKKMNINRFMRSVKKWQAKGIIYLQPDWQQHFMNGYHVGMF